MSDVTKNVVLKIDAATTGGAKNAFTDVGKGADQLDKAAQRAQRSMEGVGKAGQAAGGMLKQHLGDMARGMGLLDERLVNLSRGLTGLAGAAGISAPVLGAVGAAVVAIGSAAVLTSSRLQDQLGAGLNRMTGEADRAAAAVTRLKNNLALSTSVGAMGFATTRAEEGGLSELGPGALARIKGPFLERIRALGEDRAGLLDQNAAARMFGQTPLLAQDRADSIQRAGLAVGEGLTGPGGVNVAGVGAGLGALRSTALSSVPSPALESRNLYAAQQALARAGADQAAKSGALATAVAGGPAFEANQRALAAQERQRQALENLNEARQNATPEGFWSQSWTGWKEGAQGAWQGINKDFGGSRGPTDRQVRLGSVQRAQDAFEEAKQQRRDAESAVTGPGVSAQEIARAREAQVAATERLLQAQKAVSQAQHELNQAKIAGLKTDLQSVDAQAKAFEGIKKAAAAELESKKAMLGIMSGEDKFKALAISQRVNQGGTLNEDELAFAQQHQDLFGDAVRKQGLRQAEQDPAIKEILANLGADAKVKQAERAEKQAIEVAAELKSKIEVAVKADDQIAEKLRNEMVPKIEDAVKQLLEQITTAIKQELVKRLEGMDKNEQMKGAYARASGGGAN